jgi:hypothetical protein
MRRAADQRGRALATAVAVALAGAGCAAHRPPAAAPATAAPKPPVAGAQAAAGAELASEGAEPAAAPAETSAASAATPAEQPRLRDVCRAEPTAGGLDETRRRLQQTFCTATLWFDGLLGGEASVESAREVSGRVEISTLYTQAEGFDPKARLRLRYDLPNLERRVNLFLGRDDEDQFVEDRREGLAIRSSVFDLDTEDRWLAGLGYSPPGRWASRLDFRVGGRVKTDPEVFLQGRWRRNLFVGDRMVWRLRETLFWENRQGYGSTSSLDLDRVLGPDLVVRWGNVGTLSESTEGLAWRSAVVAYHNLKRSRGLAGEVFWRGSTDAEARVREYGVRGIYRQPVGKPYLLGELVVGYTWPRFEREEPREGSAMVGLGVEFLFGREPY